MNNKVIVNIAQSRVPCRVARNLLSCFKKYNVLTTKTVLGGNIINISRLLDMQCDSVLSWVIEGCIMKRGVT